MDEYLKTLISYRTIAGDQAANSQALDYLADFFEKHGLFVTHFDFKGDKAIIATTQSARKTPKVLLAAHLDVVIGSDEQFSLREKDGKLYGRGVADMKFAIASYMYVVEMLGNNLHNYDFGVMLVTDEESGGLSTMNLVEQGYLPDVCVLPDGAENWEIETLAKGLWWLQLTAEGKVAHGSRPWEGDSASIRLVAALHEITQAFIEQAPMTDTINIGTITAGKTVNQIPATARADIDIRFVSPSSLAKIQTIIDAICKKHRVNQKTIITGNPCVNDITNPFIATYKACLEELVGVSPQGVVSYGGSDARYFTAAGVPCIVSEPYAGNRHSDDEWIDKQGYGQYRHVLVDYLNKTARNTQSIG